MPFDSENSQDGEDNDSSWMSYRRDVLSTQRRLAAEMIRQDAKINAVAIDVATLKVKAGLWGAGGGLLSVVAFALVKILGGKGLAVGMLAALKALLWINR